MSNNKVEATFHGGNRKPKFKFPPNFHLISALALLGNLSIWFNNPMFLILFVTLISGFYVIDTMFDYMEHKFKEKNESK